MAPLWSLAVRGDGRDGGNDPWGEWRRKVNSSQRTRYGESKG